MKKMARICPIDANWFEAGNVRQELLNRRDGCGWTKWVEAEGNDDGQ
jgi:hypothetical protein